jgi:hypothetical protein
VEFGSEAVAFATLAMVLMGCSTAILIPIIFACSEHRTNESRLARPKASIQSFSARSGSGSAVPCAKCAFALMVASKPCHAITVLRKPSSVQLNSTVRATL